MRFHKVDIRGKFWLPKIDSASTEVHNGKVDEGRMFYASDTDAVYYGDEDEWVLITRKEDVLINGTKVMMGKYPLPNYWTIDTTSNDIIPLLTRTEVYAGYYSGSWTISGIQSAGAHDHGGATGTPNRNIVLGASELYDYVARDNHTHTIQSDGLHTHTFTGAWRPKYVKFLIVRYDST